MMEFNSHPKCHTRAVLQAKSPYVLCGCFACWPNNGWQGFALIAQHAFSRHIVASSQPDNDHGPYCEKIVAAFCQALWMNLNWHPAGQLGASCKFIIAPSQNQLKLIMPTLDKPPARGHKDPGVLK